MKRILLLLLLSISLVSQSQVYNNEWIDYSKTYYKFKVAATGLYRISQPVLSSIGLGSTPAEHFQLWRNGQQIPLYTSVQTGAMGASDYIEFWGEMNDGKPDNILYRLPDYQLSDKWNLITDTVAYFLTVNPAAGNLRLIPTTNNVAGNTLPVEPFFMHTAGKYYREKFNFGRSELVGDSYTYSSSYEYGEGLTSADIGTLGTLAPFITNNLSVYTGAGAPAPVVKVNAAGNAVHPRYFKVKLNGDSIFGQPLNYYDYAKITAPATIAQLSSNTANIEISNMGIEPNDRMVVAQIELIYPRQFNFGGASNFNFELAANAAGNYLEISGFSYSGPAPVLYDLTNGRRYEADITNPTLLKFALLPSGVTRKLVLVNEATANVSNVTLMQQRNFNYYALPANQGDYIIITHPVLLTSSTGNPVEEYRAYRSSADGGSYNAKIYLIDELVDQFAFGIKKNPLSIRNFLRWARINFASPLKDVLLIGKGVVYYQYKQYESDPNSDRLNMVPSFGHPASDNLLSAVPGTSVPQTPIGRISAINGDEVALYLAKVKEYEQLYSASSPVIQDLSWMKEIVHVVGASDEQTGNILLTALNGHKLIVEDTFYGGHVNTFAKNSADAVQQAESDKLTNLLNTGIGMLTYFGHSSSSSLEFNLDNPLNYTNAGRYPVFVVMGCNAGNFFNFNVARFSTKETLSEKYVLAPERGSIAFIASTHLGIVHYLDIYNTRFYTALSTSHYGKTLGEAMDAAINSVFALTTENDFYARFQCEQFTLHGDPALRMYNFSQPDYVIEDPMVKVTPSFISVFETEFKIKASFMNTGKAVSDSIVVEIRRTYPGASTSEVVFRKKIKGIRNIDSLTYFPTVVPDRDKGLNKFTITIDADGEVDESYENNNTVTKEVYIYEDEARPVYPYNFSIVNQQSPKFVASSANPFAAVRNYMMEIDTTELFNSPVKVVQSISSAGGVFEFTPGMAFTDSTVYYWRVAPTPTVGQPAWNSSSFVYLDGPSTGFNQSHYFQHTRSTNEHTILKPERNWVFDSLSHNIFVKNGVYFTATVQEGDLIVSLDGDPFIRSACEGFSLIFNLINPNTFLPVQNVLPPSMGGPPAGPNGQFASYYACFLSRSWNFEYSYMNAPRRKQMMDFMDSIPTGYYVIVRNILNNLQTTGFIDEWKSDTLIHGSGNSLYHKLKNLGFNELDSFTNPKAFAFIYKKEDSGFTPKGVISQGLYDLITLSQDIKTPDTIGYITSPVVGPAKAWQQLKWRGDMELSAKDSATIDVIGVENNGTETVLFSGIGLSQQDFDISSVDAAAYPFIKLRMRTIDTAHFTPYQLRYWRLYYTPVPEGAIAPNIYFTTKETVEVGEPFNFGIGFKNVSPVDFDSVKVKMVITDRDNIEHIVPIPRQRKLTTTAPDDTLRLNVQVNTDSIPGHNTVFIDFNPDFDQPEQYLFNNFAFRNLYVRPDSLNPLLDVTFDGLHILNRDIVSPRPDIVIKLKDEAKWMVLDDTALFTVHVKFPDGSLHKFSFDNDTLKFTPANQPPSNDNTATVNFKPWFPVDGDYELIVTGKDRSDNTAGNIEYRIGFRVFNKPMISNMLNYPNPFTTSTAFVFTITGTEIPQNLRIQILTITGKIVRDITKEELGPLRIGRNITEFKWDGTDQYGQKLANGIYLYRVITNLRGKSLDKFTDKDFGDNTDKYFNNGYGKMYLMR